MNEFIIVYDYGKTVSYRAASLSDLLYENTIDENHIISVTRIRNY